MRTIQEIEQELDENKQLDADELIQRMVSFIPTEKGSTTSSLVSAKFCAMVACDYLIDRLPNINETPPIHRKDESTYKQHWMGVKRKLDTFSAKEVTEQLSKRPNTSSTLECFTKEQKKWSN